MEKSTILALSLIFMVLVVAACGPTKEKVPRVLPNKTTDMQELIASDVLDLMDKDLLNSSFVSVKGVKLGDSAESVVARLGRPAGFESLEEGSLNLRFEDKTSNLTEMIVHLDNDKVTRIAIKEGLTDELINRSRFNYTKEDITRSFGKPDAAYDTKFYHIYEYHDRGLELYMRARRLEGFGLVPAK